MPRISEKDGEQKAEVAIAAANDWYKLVIFVIDVTGSMQDEIDAVNKCIQTQRHQFVPGTRIAIVVHRDIGDDMVVAFMDPTDNFDDCLAFLKGFRADGGDDFAEHHAAALHAAIEIIKKCRGEYSSVTLFMFTDAAAHGFAGGRGDNFLTYDTDRTDEKHPEHHLSMRSICATLNELEINNFLFFYTDGPATEVFRGVLREKLAKRFVDSLLPSTKPQGGPPVYGDVSRGIPERSRGGSRGLPDGCDGCDGFVEDPDAVYRSASRGGSRGLPEPPVLSRDDMCRAASDAIGRALSEI